MPMSISPVNREIEFDHMWTGPAPELDKNAKPIFKQA